MKKVKMEIHGFWEDANLSHFEIFVLTITICLRWVLKEGEARHGFQHTDIIWTEKYIPSHTPYQTEKSEKSCSVHCENFFIVSVTQFVKV